MFSIEFVLTVSLTLVFCLSLSATFSILLVNLSSLWSVTVGVATFLLLISEEFSSLTLVSTLFSLVSTCSFLTPSTFEAFSFLGVVKLDTVSDDKTSEADTIGELPKKYAPIIIEHVPTVNFLIENLCRLSH